MEINGVIKIETKWKYIQLKVATGTTCENRERERYTSIDSGNFS